MLTSHYSEMKLIAREEPGIVNAGMEWDAVNMVPSYRLVMGRPGRSNAFSVAAKLGMDEEILEDARNSLDKEMVRMEDIIDELEAASLQARQEQKQALEERRHWKTLKEEYENRLSALNAEKAGIIKMAKREALSIIRRAKLEFERSLKEIREKSKTRPSKLPETVSKVRRRLEEAANEYSIEDEEIQHAGEPLKEGYVSIGKVVAVNGFKEPGIVVEPPDSKGLVLLRIGNVLMRSPVSHIYKARNRSQVVETASQFKGATIDKDISPRLDVRGMTTEDMLATLDKYLDDAFLANLPSVTIIHGKGSGTLRKAVSSFLDSDKDRIKDHRPGKLNEGGMGVTIATLRTGPDFQGT